MIWRGMEGSDAGTHVSLYCFNILNTYSLAFKAQYDLAAARAHRVDNNSASRTRWREQMIQGGDGGFGYSNLGVFAMF